MGVKEELRRTRSMPATRPNSMPVTLTNAGALHLLLIASPSLQRRVGKRACG